MTNKKGFIQLNLFGEAPEIIIDVHEVGRKRNAITIFLEKIKYHKVSFSVRKLEVGDIILPNGYAVERKTIRDFLNSLIGDASGRPRLFEQLNALVEAYEHPVLLLEGNLSIRLDLRDKAIYIPITKKQIRKRIYTVIEERIGVHPNAYRGALNKIREMGIRILDSYDSIHAAELLWKLYLESKGKLSGAENVSSSAVIRMKPRLKTILDYQLFFLSGLPGISISRAKKVLKVYGNPYNAICKVHRWDLDVDGIGEKIMEKVRKVLFTKIKPEDIGER